MKMIVQITLQIDKEPEGQTEVKHTATYGESQQLLSNGTDYSDYPESALQASLDAVVTETTDQIDKLTA